MTTDLPVGWRLAKLRDVLSLEYGKSLPAHERSNEGFPVMGSNGEVGRHNEYLIKGPGIIVGRKGSHGEVVWVDENFFPIDTTYYVQCKSNVDIRFAYNYLKLADLKALNRSTAIPGLNRNDAYELNFPLPPLAEQKRIVAKLDALFGQLETLNNGLARIPELLKKFRQTILNQAVTGKLTEDWREENKVAESAADLLFRIQKYRQQKHTTLLLGAKQGKNKSPKKPEDSTFLPKIKLNNILPNHWCIGRVGDIADCLDYIRRPVNRDERLNRIGDIPYYGANGQVGWIDNYLFDDDLIVIVEDETFTGRQIPFSYIIRGKSWVNNHAHVMKPCESVSVEYLNICWAYYDFTSITTGSTGRKKLTQGALLQAEFAIAPLEEQQEIVRRVEALLARADALQAQYEQLRATVGRLPQAILAKAFRGELVPQDPTDSASNSGTDVPASDLLAQVQQQATYLSRTIQGQTELFWE